MATYSVLMRLPWTLDGLGMVGSQAAPPGAGGDLELMPRLAIHARTARRFWRFAMDEGRNVPQKEMWRRLGEDERPDGSCARLAAEAPKLKAKAARAVEARTQML